MPTKMPGYYSFNFINQKSMQYGKIKLIHLIMKPNSKNTGMFIVTNKKKRLI